VTPVPPTKLDGVFLRLADQLARVDLITGYPTGNSLLARSYVTLTGVAGRHQNRQDEPSRRADALRTQHLAQASQIKGTASPSARNPLLVAGVNDYVHGFGHVFAWNRVHGLDPIVIVGESVNKYLPATMNRCRILA
jgi:hypothetical protein